MRPRPVVRLVIVASHRRFFEGREVAADASGVGFEVAACQACPGCGQIRRELDRIELGAGSRGPITEKIQSAFFDIVNGRNPKYAHWLTKV
nr:hypothetical protein [uncultured Amaricoccus sp.]